MAHIIKKTGDDQVDILLLFLNIPQAITTT